MPFFRSTCVVLREGYEVLFLHGLRQVFVECVADSEETVLVCLGLHPYNKLRR